MSLARGWWTRVSVQVTAAMMLATAVGAAALLFFVLRAQHALVMQQTREQAAVLSDTIASALQRHMMRNERSELTQSLSAIASQPMLADLRLLDLRGRAIFSKDERERGRLMNRRDAPCEACHRAETEPQGIARNRVLDLENGRVLAAVTPIFNRPDCSSAQCHAHRPDERVLGVLEIGLSLSRADAAVAGLQRTTTGVALLTISCLGVVTILFTQMRVVSPLGKLADGVKRVTNGDLKEPVPVEGPGEIAGLGESFNQMEAALLETRLQRRALLDSLEQQVTERTAELRKAHGELLRSEKLSSLGKLAASVAHEINNPLAGILTYSKLLIRMLQEGAPDEATREQLIKRLKLVERETQRCTAIVRNLLDFARERPLTLEDVDVCAAVGEALFLIKSHVGLQNIRIEQEIPGSLLVQADFGQIRQAFVNILINAIDAMPDGGLLHVAVQELPETVQIVVKDTGMGIAAEHLNRVLDPFFTTKEKGTGLGLSVVYGIVERHSGKVSIESQVGLGTTVRIELPKLRA
jgi:two-component system, NtrC family, sensor kinase